MFLLVCFCGCEHGMALHCILWMLLGGIFDAKMEIVHMYILGVGRLP